MFRGRRYATPIFIFNARNIYLSLLFIRRMPKMCAISQLVLALLNRIPIVEPFMRSHSQCEHIRGCLHDTGAIFGAERVHSGSLSWLYICWHDTTTKFHAGASHPGCCTGARILLRYDISQRYHVNAKRPLVSVWNRSAGRLEQVAHA